MKFAKILLLGSAAGIVAVAGANAADLPSKKSAPVEYVRVCSEHGQGFFYVPGSDTCIRIGGRVRADTGYTQVYTRNGDSYNFGAQARLNLDIRTNTPYGTVRAFLRYSLTRTQSNWAREFPTTTGGPGNGGGLDLAYIQFAGLTAGRIQSFFDFYANNNTYASTRNSDVRTQVLGYTFNFGNGWSATAAIEDGNERRMIGNNPYPFNTFTGDYTIDGVRYSGWTDYGYSPAGQTVPDAVGNLMVNQGWGSAQLSAALHQVRPAFGGINTLDKETTYGFAVKGGVRLDLSMIAPGDELWSEVAYAQGALSYIGASNYSFHPNINVPITDAYVGADGQIKKTTGWSAIMAFLHYWTPSIRQNVFASYMKVDYKNSGYTVWNDAVLGSYNIGFVPTSEWRVGTNLIWSPIRNFDIGVEVLYTRVDPKGRVLSYNNGATRTISSEDHWQGRLRVQRDF